MNRIACLVLAAGQASRFGGRKQFADIKGKPMIVRSLEQLKPIFHNDLYTLIGAYAEDLRPIVEPLSEVIHHPQWESGLGSSLSKGVRAIVENRTYDGIMVVLTDQVALREEDYKYLLDQFNGQQIVAAEYSQHLGVPAIFPASFFDRLLDLKGDQGARKLIQENQDQVVSVRLPMAEIDIDTRLDLKSYHKMGYIT